MEIKRGRILSLQALRVFGFFAIYVVHTRDILPFKIPDLGGRAVELFFVLSGFTMAYNYYKTNTLCTLKASLKFSLKRMKKIYPVLLLALFLAEILVFRDFIKSGVNIAGGIEILKKVIINLLLLQSWFPSGEMHVVGSAWFLSTLMFAYFMTPLILRGIEKLRTSSNWVIAIVFIILFKILFESIWIKYIHWQQDYIFYICPFYRIFEYIIGCLLGTIFLIEKNEGNSQSKIITSILQVFACVFYIVAVKAGDSVWLRAVFTPFVAILIYYISKEDGIVARIITNKAMLHLSNISFEFFLIHFQVVVYVPFLWQQLSPSTFPRYRVLWVIMLVTSLLLSEFVHYLFNVYPKRNNKMFIKNI